MPDIDLFVLGFIFERPMYGYQISQKVEERRFHILRGIKKASIYKSLKKLENNDLIIGKMVFQKNLPQKKVYKITEKGKIEFKLRIKEELLNSSEKPMGFWALLWIIDKAVTKDTFKNALEKRKITMENNEKLFIKKHDKFIEEKGLGNLKIPFYGFRILEMVRKMIQNETMTVQNILNDLKEGKGDHCFISKEEEV
jgi:DNA-binding PadR family transcriptional regulator